MHREAAQRVQVRVHTPVGRGDARGSLCRGSRYEYIRLWGEGSAQEGSAGGLCVRRYRVGWGKAVRCLSVCDGAAGLCTRACACTGVSWTPKQAPGAPAPAWHGRDEAMHPLCHCKDSVLVASPAMEPAEAPGYHQVHLQTSDKGTNTLTHGCTHSTSLPRVGWSLWGSAGLHPPAAFPCCPHTPPPPARLSVFS